MRTPHLKPLKKGIAHGRNSYSGSEKSEYSKETPVFAYMRRSTSKIEQEDSLEKQEDCIDVIAQDHRIDESHIIAFTETRSGFENRKRPRFNEMIKAIALPGDILFQARDHMGPVSILRGKNADAYVKFASSITLRYSDAPKGEQASVIINKNNTKEEIITQQIGRAHV